MPEQEQPYNELERLRAEVPQELQAYPHFVVWRYTTVEGKIKKPAYNPKTGSLASTLNVTTWGSFEQAVSALGTDRFHGIGFVFSDKDPFTGADLDHCIQENGTIATWAQEIVTHLNSYTEYSPSGTGLHILTHATLSGPGRKVGSIEMYSEKRFFTLTAKHVPNTPTAILPRQMEQEAAYIALAPPNTYPSVLMKPQREYSVRTLGDSAVLEKAAHTKNGDAFTRLYRGDSAGFRSKSEADFTLILRLLYWTNDDIEQTKRLFRQSGLYDPEKTDKQIGEHT
ncbi:MAG: hypothetical protein ACJ788_17550 [Ktedonobacteraceae bacterium]|jgi:putative DNA primase/helicase